MRRTLAATLVLFLSTSLWAQFEHPDLKSGKVVVKNAIILPPSVKIRKNGVKENDVMLEESHQIEDALPPLVSSVLKERQCAIDDKSLSSSVLAADSDLKYALADLQKRFDELFPQLVKKPKDVRKGRFTLGDEVAKLNPGGAADALVFVRGFGSVTTGGKFMLSALAGYAQYSGTIYYITVVDARTGSVLYHGVATQGGNPAKNPTGSRNSIEKSFKNFPGKVKS